MKLKSNNLKLYDKKLEDLSKLDYFNLFNLKKQLPIDKKVLNLKYQELIKTNHPDNFYGEKEDLATINSEIINHAFKILSNQEETIKYLVKDFTLDEIDQKLLEEIFELQEKGSKGDKDWIRNIQTYLENIEQELCNLINQGSYYEAKQLFNKFLLMKKI
jgi:hypothetical protein